MPSRSPETVRRRRSLTMQHLRMGSELQTNASHTERRRPTGDTQTLEGSTTMPWVPRSGEEVAQGGTFDAGERHGGLLHTDSEHPAQNREHVDDAVQKCALGVNWTSPRTARARPVHDGHARHVGTNSGGVRISRTTTTKPTVLREGRNTRCSPCCCCR